MYDGQKSPPLSERRPHEKDLEIEKLSRKFFKFSPLIDQRPFPAVPFMLLGARDVDIRAINWLVLTCQGFFFNQN